MCLYFRLVVHIAHKVIKNIPNNNKSTDLFAFFIQKTPRRAITVKRGYGIS